MAQKRIDLALDADRLALDDLARSLEGLAAGDHAASDLPGDDTAEIELEVAELVGDRNGEIVLFNDSGVRTLGLTASAPVVADGRAAAHVTACGADVSGYRFYTFADGPTLYFEEGLEVIVRARATHEKAVP
jgi:hypothetical protein